MTADRPHVFQNKTFVVWLLSRFFSSFGKQMQALIVAWQVYQLVHNPLALGGIGLAEALPFVAMALWAGHSADRYEKKKQITGSIAGSLTCSVILLALSTTARPSIFPIYGVLAVAGLLSSFEFSSTSAYVQMVVPAEDYRKAIAWNLSLYQIATIAGPVVGGLIISRFGPAAAYGTVAVSIATALVLSLSLKKIPPTPSANLVPTIESIKLGLRFIVSQQIILGCMVLDMVGVFFGDVIAILPMFAADIFHVGPVGLGLLRASPAIGSLVMSLLQANHPSVRISWKNFLITVTAFGGSIIAFAFAPNFLIAMLFLAGSGLADAVSVIIRQTVYQRYTPDDMRGRVASVSSIFIRTSNEMGAFESGLAARFLGTIPSVLFGGAITLLSVVLVKLKFPHPDESKLETT